MINAKAFTALNTMTSTVLLLVFLSVSGLAFWALYRLMPDPVIQRIQTLGQGRAPSSKPWSERLQPAIHRILLRLSPLAASAQASESLNWRLIHAGARHPAARLVYLAGKTLATFLLPVLTALFFWLKDGAVNSTNQLFWVVLAASAGYYLPNLMLNRLIAQRRQRLFRAFPDALDLMRVCVQAGLGLDAALDRVGREMALASPDLSEEFSLTGLELRAGIARADGLRHLAQRVNLKEIDALVSMLVQADRFGTSVAESLQVHAEALRTQRRLAAEEAAAKLPVKLLVPLVFCVFPALLAVLIGPALVSLWHNFQPASVHS
ncbi:MAG: type II secretion system F family protein [Burkholderiales bacterium]